MDLLSPASAPGDEDGLRAVRRARVVGLGGWAVGAGLLSVACWQRSPAGFAVFGAWYLGLAALALVLSAASRRSQVQAARVLALRFRELAIRDDLTGLYNRRYFNSELESQVLSCRSARVPLTIAILDLNGFKDINDSFGHAAGDMALRAAAAAILGASPESATVARTGGDEFAVIMPGVSPAEAHAVARSIHRALSGATFVVDGQGKVQGSVDATIGVASLGASQEPGDLLREADAALYAGKRALKAA